MGRFAVGALHKRNLGIDLAEKKFCFGLSVETQFPLSGALKIKSAVFLGNRDDESRDKLVFPHAGIEQCWIQLIGTRLR